MTMTTTQHPSDRRTDAPGTLSADVPGLRFSLVALLGFVGLGGVYGAVQMLADPYRPMGMSTHMIARTPFDSFVVPGVLLLLLVGVAPLFLAVGLLARTHLHPGWVAAYGVGLMAWIVTQWVVVDARLWLQPVIFGIGFVIVVLAAALWRRENRCRERRVTP
jgi:hypothetical protein